MRHINDPLHLVWAKIIGRDYLWSKGALKCNLVKNYIYLKFYDFVDLIGFTYVCGWNPRSWIRIYKYSWFDWRMK